MKSILAALLVSVPAFAQTAQPVPPSQLSQAEQAQLALGWATLENAQLKLQLTASEIEKSHPGMHYDFQTRQMVPNPVPAKIDPPKK